MGYYQFQPNGANVVFSIYAYYFGGGALLGTGYIHIESATTSYTQFSFDVLLSDTPDSLMLQLELIGEVASSIGSYALVDQLSLGGTSDVEPINFNPSDFSLKQNYPNPFNPATTIEFSIPQESFVELKVYDILGNEVTTLASEYYPAGNYKADFSGDDLTSGIYIAKMSVGDFAQTRKMILIK